MFSTNTTNLSFAQQFFELFQKFSQRFFNGGNFYFKIFATLSQYFKLNSWFSEFVSRKRLNEDVSITFWRKFTLFKKLWKNFTRELSQFSSFFEHVTASTDDFSVRILEPARNDVNKPLRVGVTTWSLSNVRTHCLCLFSTCCMFGQSESTLLLLLFWFSLKFSRSDLVLVGSEASVSCRFRLTSSECGGLGRFDSNSREFDGISFSLIKSRGSLIGPRWTISEWLKDTRHDMRDKR